MARLTYQQFGERFIQQAVTAAVLTREFNKAMGNKPLKDQGKEGPATYFYTGTLLSFGFQPRPPEEFDVVLPLKMDFSLRPLVGLERWLLDIFVPFRIRVETYEPLIIYLNHTTVAPEQIRITRYKQSVTELWWSKVEEALRPKIADEVNKGLRDSKEARTIDVLKQIQGGMSALAPAAPEPHALSEEALRCLSEVDLSKAAYETDPPNLHPRSIANG